MAIYKSDIITAKDSLDVSGKSLSGEKTGAQVLYATAEYVFRENIEITDDIIELADIPAGATVVPELSYVRKSFGYRDLKLSLGDKDSAARFGAVGTSDTGIPLGPSLFGYGIPCQANFGHGMATDLPRYVEETRVRATLQGITEYILPGEKLRFGIAYRVQG
ncbi:hypothetical protein OVA24_16530 [Luteolibacter sp. SL250]|uniref:hypothetical protein n=1 Tax=Luteolibacter sp. SL250 TaxID=2995170 RepID=UPI00227108C8|nr:hypothetical protein [Luteolibacter sp. SL250]WAC18838.1 hypothetical protein OVA24_16530 [Luteolibacter sp. SL250]